MQDENNRIADIVQLLQYAKLFLRSDAILAVLIADGTFQSCIYRSAMIIVMVISRNKTNIPIAWGWSLSENSKIISIALNLIKEVQPTIKTFLFDQGKAIKKSIDDLFPGAHHHFCA